MKPALPLARLKALARLHDRRYRRSEGLMLVEGPRLVSEAVAAGLLTDVLVEDEASEIEWRSRCELPVHHVGSEWMGRIATVKTPQKVMGVGSPPVVGDLEQALNVYPRILALDAVQDPGNVGVLSRIAHGLGIGALLLGPGSADPFSPKVLRSSAGALFHLPVHRAEDFDQLSTACRASGHRLVLPVVTGGADLREAAAPDRYLLVAGNEGAGTTLDPSLPEVFSLTIPLTSGCESLNVASACAAILGRWLA